MRAAEIYGSEAAVVLRPYRGGAGTSTIKNLRFKPDDCSPQSHRWQRLSSCLLDLAVKTVLIEQKKAKLKMLPAIST